MRAAPPAACGAGARRVPRCAAVAALVVLGACLAAVAPGTARALTDARRVAALAMIRTTAAGEHITGAEAVDRALVLAAWRRAGVDTAGTRAHLPSLDSTRALQQECASPLSLDPRSGPAVEPAPGDYALYRDAAGAVRVAMFVSPVELVVYDAGAGRGVAVRRSDLDGGAGPVSRTAAYASAILPDVHACRLRGARWPLADDLGRPAGRVALVEPGVEAQRARWSALHPRDADTSLGHGLGTIIGAGLGVVSAALSGVVDAALSAMARLLPLGGPGTAAVGLALWLMSRTFDGRGLHRAALIVAAVALVFLLPLGVAVALGAAWALAWGAGALRVPVAGRAGGAVSGMFANALQTLTSILTGVDGDRPTAVGTMLVSLVALPLVWLRPVRLLALLRPVAAPLAAVRDALPGVRGARALLDPLATGPRTAVGAAGMLSDAVALRPLGLRAVAIEVESARGVAGVMAATHGPATGAGTLASLAWRASDPLSWLYRAPSAIAGDVTSHVSDLLRFVADEAGRGADPSWPAAMTGRAVHGLSPALHARLGAAAVVASRTWIPRAVSLGRMSHLHSGARTLSAMAGGRAPAGPPLPPPLEPHAMDLGPPPP